jgi:Rrf2 family protein
MFNKETEYALRALVYIQVQNYKSSRPGIEEIVKEIDAPGSFVAKILQRMVRNGFIKSVKGKGGGFFFDPDKSELPLRDVIVSVQGDQIFTGCGFGLKYCNDEKPCPLHEQYAGIRDSIDKLVKTETVQSLAKKEIKLW